MSDKREVGESGAGREQRQESAAEQDTEGRDEASALGGHTATRSGTRPTPPDEKAGA